MHPSPSLPPKPARRFNWRAVAAIGFWGLALAFGFRALVKYELKAGTSAAAPSAWVEGTRLDFDPARTNLVMFVHPRCPCSRASLAELAVIMTRAGDHLRATVCFFNPDNESEDWTHTSLWRSATSIPGVNLVADRHGDIATRFGSVTSGQVFLFAPDGRRLFAGGITGARGHEGDNDGRSLVIALARGELCAASSSPVFGCSLHDPQPPSPQDSP